MPLPVGVRTKSNTPYYHPQQDYINMPKMTAFPTVEAFFHVLYHEISHCTGHPKRLNRNGVSEPQRFGSWIYSQDYPYRKIIPNFWCKSFISQLSQRFNTIKSCDNISSRKKVV
jgi:antirestriction protein ArdC